jgi:nucleotide-binding universal stress UspA family protein
MMREIKKVMVATDLTPDSKPAHRAAAFLADQCGADLIVFHVLGELDPRYSMLVEDVSRHMLKDAEEAVSAVKQELNSAHKCSIKAVIREGAVLDEISKVMKEESIDMMVLGTGSVHTGHPNRLGITAKRIAHKIPCDMLFARSGSEGPWDKVIVATDFSSCAGVAFGRACKIAREYGAKSLTVVHAFDVPQTFHRLGLSEEQVVPKMRKHAEKGLEEWLADNAKHSEGLEIERVVVTGDPAAAVCKEATARGSNLIVVGAHGRTASAAVLLGNVAERIIRDAPCSVWTERAEGQGLTFAKAIARLMGID